MQTKKSCQIWIETQILSPSGMRETMRLESAADWHLDGAELHIRYREGAADAEIDSHLNIHMENQTIQLTRSGAVRFHHIFRTGEKTESPYENAYGILMYRSHTKKVQLEMRHGKPERLVLQYDLFFNEEPVGEFTVEHRFVDLVLPTRPAVH